MLRSRAACGGCEDPRQVIPAGGTVFHEGILLTVITTDGQIVAVDRRSGRTRRRYPSPRQLARGPSIGVRRTQRTAPDDGNGYPRTTDSGCH